jgi:hypothetical protein
MAIIPHPYLLAIFILHATGTGLNRIYGISEYQNIAVMKTDILIWIWQRS